VTAQPKDAFLDRVLSIEERVRSLHDSIAFSDSNRELAEMEAQITDLPASIREIRTRGYVFKNYLERKADVLEKELAELRPRITQSIDEYHRDLSQEAGALSQRIVGLRYSRSETALAATESAISSLESRVQAAKGSVESMYAQLKENAEQTADQVKEISWALDQIDKATFSLYPSEGLISASEAQWLTNDDEGPKGILFLTDERVLFEQQEEIATKKRLFITTERQKIQELKWQAALGLLELAKASERGGRFLGIGKKELLELEFAEDAKIGNVLLRMKTDSDAWQALIGRAKSQDIAGERTVQKDQTLVEAARAAPTKCTNCGATITQAVVKGMTEIKCEYCGAVMRI
jgi:predicted  nucleic acid-binding Zn-ribbon protein